MWRKTEFGDSWRLRSEVLRRVGCRRPMRLWTDTGTDGLQQGTDPESANSGTRRTVILPAGSLLRYPHAPLAADRRDPGTAAPGVRRAAPAYLCRLRLARDSEPCPRRRQPPARQVPQTGLAAARLAHPHADPSCPIARLPESNREYRLPKPLRSAARAARNQYELRSPGRFVLVIRECGVRSRSGFLGMQPGSPAAFR